MNIYQHPHYQLMLNEEAKIMEFAWKPAHAEMNYDDFKAACSNYIGFAFEYQIKKLLIDTSSFKFSLPKTFEKWRDNFHLPRFHKLGVTKVAYIAHLDWIEQTQNVNNPNGFSTYYFSNKNQAIDWLNA